MDRIVVLLIVFVVLVLCGLIAVLLVKKKIKATTLIVVGLSCILVTVVLLNTVFYYNQDVVVINTSSENNADKFALKIDSHKIQYEHYHTKFSTSSTLKDLMGLIKEKYPEDKVSMNQNVVRVVHNNQVVTLKEEGKGKFLWQDRNRFSLDSNFFGLEVSENKFVSIPFPKEYLDIEDTYSKKMKLKCDISELKKFYEGFSNVEFGDNTITINQDIPILITVEGSEVMFEFQ